MSQTYAASSSRQSAVLTAIVGLHFLAFLVIAAGLGPRIFERAPEPPPVKWVKVIEPVAPVIGPDETAPVDAYADSVVEPDVVLPSMPLSDDRIEIARESGEASGSSAGAATLPVDYVPPQRRTQDRRLAALINACYPAGARRDGEEGRLVARIAIGANSLPATWSVAESSGFARLDQAAGCVIRRIDFVAGRRDGIAVSADVLLPITFQLD